MYEVHTDVWKRQLTAGNLLNSSDGTCSMSALYHAMTGEIFTNKSWWNSTERKSFMEFVNSLEFKADEFSFPLTTKDTTYKGVFDSMKGHAKLFDDAESE